MVIDDDKIRKGPIPFNTALPQRSQVAAPIQTPKKALPTAGQAVSAGARSAGAAVSRATNQFALGAPTAPANPAVAAIKAQQSTPRPPTAGDVIKSALPKTTPAPGSVAAAVEGLRTQPQRPAPTVGSIFRSGNAFSDQQRPGSTPYTPGSPLTLAPNASPARSTPVSAAVNASAIRNNVGDAPGRGLTVAPAFDLSNRPGAQKMIADSFARDARERTGAANYNATQTRRIEYDQAIKSAENMLQKALPGSDSARALQSQLLSLQAGKAESLGRPNPSPDDAAARQALNTAEVNSLDASTENQNLLNQRQARVSDVVARLTQENLPPEEQRGLYNLVMSLQGQKPAPFEFKTIDGGADASGYQQPARAGVFDPNSGTFKPLSAEAPTGYRVVGTANGKRVFEDEAGNRFTDNEDA